MTDELHLRIHGDNIVECERALEILVSALHASVNMPGDNSIIAPRFLLRPADIKWAGHGEVSVELLAGHGRWGVDIAAALKDMGSPLRENADAVVTRVSPGGEVILLAFEFCGALPAGNNAWQRHGRALGFARAGIPYLIVAEVGGSELTAARERKASRLPNPAVPASLLLLSSDLHVPVLPVYELAPSAPLGVATTFEASLGREIAGDFMAAMVLGHQTEQFAAKIRMKGVEMVRLLADGRTRTDSLPSRSWNEILENPDSRTSVYEASALEWRISGLGQKVRASDTARELLRSFSALSPKPLGAAGIRFAYIDGAQRPDLASAVGGIYGSPSDAVVEWLATGVRPLVLVLITGFKPGGEDSRPDRGLAPMARMLAGEDMDILSVMWGPAKPNLVERMRQDLTDAARQNGLVESVVATSDALIVDGPDANPFLSLVSREPIMTGASSKGIPAATRSTPIGEHDVDTATHLLFTQPNRVEFFEGLCNPPGGDWSGISLMDAEGRVARWTSLPRVSGATKRPDHVIQVSARGTSYVLAVESKSAARDLESGVGPRLCNYVIDLVDAAPTVTRLPSQTRWSPNGATVGNPAWNRVYSVGMFVWSGLEALRTALARSQCDLVAAWDLDNPHEPVLHLLPNGGREFLVDDFLFAVTSSLLSVKVEKH